MVKSWGKRLRRGLRAAPPAGNRPLLQRQRRAFWEAGMLVRAVYILAAYRAFGAVYNNTALWLRSERIDGLWPLFWLDLAPTIASAVYPIALGSIAAGILALLHPERRSVRIIFFVAFLQLVALANSFGKINHGLHALLATSFILIFLPAGAWSQVGQRIAGRHMFLTVIWACQALLLTNYTMSGLHKLIALAYQLRAGEMSALHPDALAYQTVFRLLQTNEVSLLGPLLIDYPRVGWPLYLGTLYLETFALVAAFRPGLHRLWGIGLIMFHLGTWLIMNVVFFENMLLLGLLLVNSPARPERQPWRELLRQLPLIGGLAAGGIMVGRRLWPRQNPA